MRALAVIIAVLAAAAPYASAFKANEFKTCSQSSFCDRLRTKQASPPYAIRAGTLRLNLNHLEAKVDAPPAPPADANATSVAYVHDALDLRILAYAGGTLRVQITEPGRFEVPSVLEPDLDETQIPLVAATSNGKDPRGSAAFAFEGGEVVVSSNPLRIDVWRATPGGGARLGKHPAVVFNQEGLFHFERRAVADPSHDWKEKFGSHGDDRPNGPMAISLDVGFPGVQHVYGIPERATSFSLPSTRGKEPYRLYNLDVFEYLHDHPFGLYGSIPFITAHAKGELCCELATPQMRRCLPPLRCLPPGLFAPGHPIHPDPSHLNQPKRMALGSASPSHALLFQDPLTPFFPIPFLFFLSFLLFLSLLSSLPWLSGATSGVFWLNAAEMYVDVWDASLPLRSGGKGTQWMAESGAVDAFVFLGPSPSDVARQYASVAGATSLPQMFSLGYHQCRWNYKDEKDVLGVDAGLDAHRIPCDVVWLDIEHTNGKRYMTWDRGYFPNPEKMQVRAPLPFLSPLPPTHTCAHAHTRARTHKRTHM